MLRNILIFTYIICILLLGAFKIGPLTLNNYATLLMAIILLFTIKKLNKTFINKDWILFILFSFVFFITLLFNGDIIYFNFINYFFGRIIPCVITFIAISRFVQTKKDINFIFFILIFISIINLSITILQYNSSSFAFAFGKLFTSKSELDILFYGLETEIRLGITHIFGIFGGAVHNGFMISTLFLLPVLFWGKNIIANIAIIALLITSIIAIYFVQQRAAFLLMGLSLVVVIIRHIKLKHLFLFLPLLIFLISFFYQFSSTVDMGRLANLEDMGRVNMYRVSWDWLSENILLGGPSTFGKYLYSKVGFADPHNFFLSALAYGGIFGGILIIILFIRMISFSFKNIINVIKTKPINPEYNITFILSILMSVALLNGLTHNNSLVYGYSNLWLFYALLTRAYQLKI